MQLLQKLKAPGPKRILALDGGGIRGALTLGYLQKIEDLLRRQYGSAEKFRLCDYFDLIGGTSTGSIIAACLAIGMSVEEIKKKYLQLGGEIFADKHKWYEIFKRAKAKFDAGPLERHLKEVFGDITLASDQIKTGLCIVAKRADTNSTWPIINHPEGKYYDSKDGKNKDIPLWKAVRASTAAPSYFLPEIIDVGGGIPKGAFVDGGVSMAGNPALQLLMVATLKGFPFQWQLGAENILLVSVGTGMGKPDQLPKQITDNHRLNWAKQVPDMFMQDASWLNQIVLQWLSSSPTSWEIDGEIGNLEDDLLVTDTSKKGLISYLRYNLWLDAENLKRLIGKDYSKAQIDSLVEMSNADNRNTLHEIGVKAAEEEIKAEHFSKTFVPKL